MKIGKLDRIEVDWIDSHHTAGWHHDENFEWEKHAESALDQKTIGYFMHESKRAICVVQSYGQVKDDLTHDAIMCIPKITITSKRKI